jgi:hypothetical protein
MTCEAVIAEACYLLRRAPGAPEAVIRNVANGVFQTPARLADRADTVEKLLRKYRDVSMDLADACLVNLADQTDARTGPEFFARSRRGRRTAQWHLKRGTFSGCRIQPPFTQLSAPVNRPAPIVAARSAGMPGSGAAADDPPEIKEDDMDIVIAAEKPTIADLLSEHLRCRVNARDISVRPNPEETGSFLINWRLNRYLLSPDGRLALRAIRVDG